MNDPPEDAIDRLRDDEYLGPVVEELGVLRLDPNPDLFERMVISVLRQQVSMASAAAIEGRLFDNVSVTPEGILEADDELLREVGLSKAKVRYVNAIAEAFVEHGYSREMLADATNEEIVDTLTGITGVGPWTARMQLMFVFGRPDIFPVEDLGIRKGMEDVFGEEMTWGEMRDAAMRWAPYRSYASLYLWRMNE